MSIRSIYLILYNLCQFLLWTLFFVKVSLAGINSKSIQDIYDETHIILEYCQYGAYLELIHSLARLVKSNLFATAIKILGRIEIVVILNCFKRSISIGYIYLSFAWSLNEIIRYSYYILCLIKIDFNSMKIPYIHTWCRYSFFIVLDPMGIAGEMITLLNARKVWVKYRFGSNFTVEVLIYPIYALYIPGLIFSYSYLFKQRSIILRNINPEKKIKTE